MDPIEVDAWLALLGVVGAGSVGAAAAIISAHMAAKAARGMAASAERTAATQLKATLDWERERLKSEGERQLRDRDSAFKRERFTMFLNETAEAASLTNSFEHMNLEDAEAATAPDADRRKAVSAELREASLKLRASKALATEMSLYAPAVSRAAEHYWLAVFSRSFRQSHVRKAVNKSASRPVVIADCRIFKGASTEVLKAPIAEARQLCQTAMRADLGIPEPPPEAEDDEDED